MKHKSQFSMTRPKKEGEKPPTIQLSAKQGKTNNK